MPDRIPPVCAEVDRLQARLREVEAELEEQIQREWDATIALDETRAELERVRGAARDALSDDSATGYQTYRCALRHIADGEV